MYKVPATLITKSRALSDISRAASVLCVSARASFRAAKSSTDCDTDTRASKMLNGPMMLGKPGNVGTPGDPKPKACRLTFCRVSVMRPFAFGSSSLSIFQRTPRARPMSCSASSTPRLC